MVIRDNTITNCRSRSIDVSSGSGETSPAGAHGEKFWHYFLYWLIKLNALSYVVSGNSTELNELTDKSNQKEGRDLEARDFTGHDFTAWVYDRHPPRETYQERGIHPSGVGLNRYIKFSDLTFDERTFLRRQARLQWLNLLDPYLIGLKEWRIPTSTSVKVQSEYGAADFIRIHHRHTSLSATWSDQPLHRWSTDTSTTNVAFQDSSSS